MVPTLAAPGFRRNPPRRTPIWGYLQREAARWGYGAAWRGRARGQLNRRRGGAAGAAGDDNAVREQRGARVWRRPLYCTQDFCSNTFKS